MPQPPHFNAAQLPLEPPAADPSLRQRAARIAQSYQQLLGQALVQSDDPDTWRALWLAPRAIVAHGVETDPAFFYGNRLALQPWRPPCIRLARTVSPVPLGAPSGFEHLFEQLSAMTMAFPKVRDLMVA